MPLTSQDINQFEPTAARGNTPLALSAGALAIAVAVSPNQVNPIQAGDAVRLDGAQNLPGLPWIIAAGIDDTAHGIAQGSVKAMTFYASGVAGAPGDVFDMLTNLGPFSVQVAAATVYPGNILETTSTGAVQVKSAHVAKYMAIDYATVGQTVRCALLPVQL